MFPINPNNRYQKRVMTEKLSVINGYSEEERRASTCILSHDLHARYSEVFLWPVLCFMDVLQVVLLTR